jgi:catechol 2,3-dioxygenase-like lactoylglutathione lyase family enzyme
MDPMTSGVDHVGLTVRDLDQTRRFFCDYLGWQVVGENTAYPAVFVSDGQDRVTLWQVHDREDCVSFDRRRDIGLHHLELKVADVATLECSGESRLGRGSRLNLPRNRRARDRRFTTWCGSPVVFVSNSHVYRFRRPSDDTDASSPGTRRIPSRSSSRFPFHGGRSMRSGPRPTPPTRLCSSCGPAL